MTKDWIFVTRFTHKHAGYKTYFIMYSNVFQKCKRFLKYPNTEITYKFPVGAF